MKNLIVDLTDVKSKEDMLKRFNDVFDFVIEPACNWDSLMYMSKMPDEKNIHLIIKNIHNVKRFSEKEYNTLLDILVSSTDKGQRQDGINLTFEVSNDYK